MKQMVDSACSFFGAFIRNIIVISIAGVLVIGVGIFTIIDLSDQVKMYKAQVNSLSEVNAAQEETIADQAETISALEREKERLQKELAAVSPDPSVGIRLEIRFLGFLKLVTTSFPRSVSREVFDSLNVGDEISAAPWLEDASAPGIVSVRFFVADKFE